MQVATYDPTVLNQMIDVLDSIHQHRIKNPLNKSDEMYYRIIGDYYRAIRDAEKMGKQRVYHTAMLPTEIFYAMDLVPAMFEPVAMSLCNLANNYEDGLAASKAYGFAPETCSAHRLMLGIALNGWLPKPDALVWSFHPCDNTAKSNDNLRRLWDCPGFYVDGGYYFAEREMALYTQELRDAISFLEELTGRKMDYDRLSEYVARTQEIMDLQREIEELKKATPAPMRSRAGMLGHMVGIYMHGTQDAVDLLRQLRDEAKEHVQSGTGSLKQEKYRLLMYFEPPVYGWKILDWMDRVHNAVIVYEPVFGSWAEGELDPSKPLESLVKKTFLRPGWTLSIPVEPLVESMVKGAKDYNVDGVITFTSVTCRQSSQCNRIIKDAIAEETGLPFLSVECDIADPAFAPEEEMRDKIEGFFEMIDERKG